MEVIWLKQLKLTISRNIWNVTNNIETLLHHYWSLFTQVTYNTMWTVFTSSYLKHDLFNICLYFYVCGVYLLSSFFYILCWRGRYVEANSAEFDFILPLSLSWCNLCGRNRATGTHISTFVLINLNFVNEFTLFYFKTNLLFIFFKMNFVFFLKTIVPCDIPKNRKRKKKAINW